LVKRHLCSMLPSSISWPKCGARGKEEEEELLLLVVVRGERRSVPSLRERPLRVLLLGAAGERRGRRVAICAVVVILVMLVLVLVLRGVERMSMLVLRFRSLFFYWSVERLFFLAPVTMTTVVVC